jgi:hypothetical protein
VTLGHDTLMGAVLLASGGLTIWYTRAGARNLRMWAIIGAAATIIIGLLLLFGLA